MKKCSKCKEKKPMDQFSKDVSAPDGRKYHCKTCCLSYLLKKKEAKKQDIRFF